MSRLDSYLIARWRVRMGEVFDVIGRVRCVVPPSGAPGKWAPCFDGLHELLKLDARLAGRVLDLLRQCALRDMDLQALQQCARFARRQRPGRQCGALEGLPPCGRCILSPNHDGDCLFNGWEPARRDDDPRPPLDTSANQERR